VHVIAVASQLSPASQRPMFAHESPAFPSARHLPSAPAAAPVVSQKPSMHSKSSVHAPPTATFGSKNDEHAGTPDRWNVMFRSAHWVLASLR